jgi:predicted component of type VI protein secretion system
MNGGADAGAAPADDPREGLELLEVLEALADGESKITEAIYPLFFERRPDVRPLFGVHALAEREEMIRETLRSLLALAEGGSHLATNLEALGRSHFEYGVTGDMYGDFVEAFVEVAAPGLPEARRAVLRRGLVSITDAMRRAGDAAAREHAARHA